MAYKDEIFSKQLTEMDIEYLIRAKFQKWMQYLINSHFRVELNVPLTQPIPNLSDFLTEDEINANKILIQNEIELRDAMVRDDV